MFGRMTRVLLVVASVLALNGVASAQAITPDTFGIVAADYVGGAVTAVGGWLAPALTAGIGLLAIWMGYRLIRRFVAR